MKVGDLRKQLELFDDATDIGLISMTIDDVGYQIYQKLYHNTKIKITDHIKEIGEVHLKIEIIDPLKI